MHNRGGIKKVKEDVSNINKNKKSFRGGNMSYKKGEILKRELV